ncbi:MAG: hypothetical protein H7X97_12990 [Opitutaceae bacterium]|nr:hypothetical protein [Verrucomicrobiales bacterium]
MMEVIEKLLILQDRDRRLIRLNDELAHVDPERTALLAKATGTQAALDQAKQKVMHIESERKRLELDVDALKQKIDKYSIQQFQTKKNDEFKALGHEIDAARAAIMKLDDQQIELMEKIEAAQKDVAAAAKLAAEAKKGVDAQMTDLAAREANLRKELGDLDATREQLAAGIDESALARYERLLKNKGENVVVGIAHGVCGGCHMKFPLQIVVSCKQEQELITCPNCGRILYFTRDMDMAMAD